MGEVIGRALLSLTITPKSTADQEQLVRGVGTLMTEDPKMSATIDASTGETVIGGIAKCIRRYHRPLKTQLQRRGKRSRLKVVYAGTATYAADARSRSARRARPVCHVKVRLFR
jgi:hypothetical protein